MVMLRIAVTFFALVTGLAQAQSWPARQVRFVVPFPPGGSTDVAARALADKLSRALGQQVIVDNRAGGGGVIGTSEVARAAPDGQTILFAANQVSTMHLVVKNIPYDMTRDFVPVTQATTQPMAIAVHTSLPAKNVREFVALAKARPGELSYAHSGVGGGQHMTGELLKKVAKFDMVGVPYKGGGQAVLDLVSGHVPVCVLGSTPLIPHHKSGRIRIIAFTSKERFLAMPEIPTLHDSGYPGFDSIQWLGVLAPRGTGAEIVQRLHAETVKALALPDVKERLAANALQPVGNTPQQFAEVIRADIDRWTKLAREIGIKPE
ncbi:MAG TPA: tripartite tricarboxylate transporter substrate binding protein [Burkholderiales bacterium]|nr:tripartite tricarboxylate transporter substrate binding protein [Burkholderiales bacterium]